jgi:hypothetical protein
MTTTTRAPALRGPLRTTTFLLAAAIGGTGLLLAGCSQGSSTSSASSARSAPGGSAHGSALAGGAVQGADATQAPNSSGQVSSRLGGQSATLALASPSIIYTASLTVQAANVTAATSAAADIADAAGGYVSSQQESIQSGHHAASSASLQLKIPAPAYPATLSLLTTRLGTLTSLSRQAQDATQQVADVGSMVTSAQAAIKQLRALLSRAGSVGGLLQVQEQINSQESSLEALLAQQRALSRETSYATVSLRLIRHPKAVKGKKKRKQRGFVAGLSGGWRALRLVVSGLLTALGAVLPFAVIVAVAGVIAYGGRRRVLRRRSGPTAAA